MLSDNIKSVKVLIAVLTVIFLFSAYIYAEDKTAIKETIKTKADNEVIKVMVENQKEAIKTISVMHTESKQLQEQANAEFRQAILDLYKKQIETEATLKRIEEKIEK